MDGADQMIGTMAPGSRRGEHGGGMQATNGNGNPEAKPDSRNFTEPVDTPRPDVTGSTDRYADGQLEFIHKTLSPAEHQLAWDSRRRFLEGRINSLLFDSIPLEFSRGALDRLMPMLTALHQPHLANCYPQEQREFVVKTMSPSEHQLHWDSRRRFLMSRVDPGLFERIPEQYSPEAKDGLIAWLSSHRRP